MGKTIGVVLALKDKCSPQLKKIADRMGLTEKEAKKLHRQAQSLSKDLGAGIKKASVICAGALAGVTVATQQLVSRTMEAGDRIDKMSQKIGMSRKSFQEWDYIMSQNGGNVESLQMGYKTLTNQMANVSKESKESTAIFKRLGVSVKDNNGQLRNQEDVFNDTVRAIQNLKNPTEKAIISNKLFGRSAIEMKPLLNQSADSVDALRQKANDLGLVMSDDAVNGSVKLKDTMDTMQRTFNALGVYVGSQFIPIIQQVSDTIITNMPQIKATVEPIIQGLSSALTFLANNMNILIPIATGLVSTFVAFNVIQGVITTITTLQKVIQLVTVAQGVWNAVMLANPIGAVAVAIGGVIALITALAMNWDKVTAIATDFGKKAMDSFKSMWKVAKPILEKVVELIKTAFNFTPIGIAVNGAKAIGDAIAKTKKPKKHALGTSYSSGGPAIVGEFGPELVNLNRGDSVTPKDKTQQALRGNTNIELNINIAGNLIGNDAFINQLKNTLALELKTALATY